MKKYLLLLTLHAFYFTSFAQKGPPIGTNGVHSDSRLSDLFENIKNRVEDQKTSVDQIKGSPYFDESFKLAKVEYFGKILKDKIYLRYNAYSDEMEMVSNPQLKNSETILIKNNKVACIIDENAYRYLGYVDENETPAVGYVLELFKGEKLSFYERNEKVYMGATQARTSLERSFPARFVDKKKFYFSIENGSLKEVKLNKKKVSNSLKAYDKDVKSYISTSKTKLKSKEDVLQLLSFIEKN